MSYATAYDMIGLTVRAYSASVLLLIYESRRNRGTLLLTAIAAPAFLLAHPIGPDHGDCTVYFRFNLRSANTPKLLYAGVLMALLAYRHIHDFTGTDMHGETASICVYRILRPCCSSCLSLERSASPWIPMARYYALLRETTDLLRFGLFPLGFFISSYGFLRGLGLRDVASLGCVGLGDPVRLLVICPLAERERTRSTLLSGSQA
jgi:hypothetical protein